MRILNISLIPLTSPQVRYQTKFQNHLMTKLSFLSNKLARSSEGHGCGPHISMPSSPSSLREDMLGYVSSVVRLATGSQIDGQIGMGFTNVCRIKSFFGDRQNTWREPVSRYLGCTKKYIQPLRRLWPHLFLGHVPIRVKERSPRYGHLRELGR